MDLSHLRVRQARSAASRGTLETSRFSQLWKRDSFSIPTLSLLKRSPDSTSAGTATSSCVSTQNANTCEKPASNMTNVLPIVLGITVPIIAIVVFFFLHRRYKRRLQTEDRQDAEKYKSMDFGMDLNFGPNKRKRGPDMATKGGLDVPRQVKGLSMEDGHNPFFFNDSNHAKQSTDSLGDDDPYKIVRLVDSRAGSRSGSPMPNSRHLNRVGTDSTHSSIPYGSKFGSTQYDQHVNLVTHAQSPSMSAVPLGGSIRSRADSATSSPIAPVSKFGERLPFPPPNKPLPQLEPAMVNNNGLAAPSSNLTRDSYFEKNAASMRKSNNYLAGFFTAPAEEPNDQAEISGPSSVVESAASTVVDTRSNSLKTPISSIAGDEPMPPLPLVSKDHGEPASQHGSRYPSSQVQPFENHFEDSSPRVQPFEHNFDDSSSQVHSTKARYHDPHARMQSSNSHFEDHTSPTHQFDMGFENSNSQMHDFNGHYEDPTSQFDAFDNGFDNSAQIQPTNNQFRSSHAHNQAYEQNFDDLSMQRNFEEPPQHFEAYRPQAASNQYADADAQPQPFDTVSADPPTQPSMERMVSQYEAQPRDLPSHHSLEASVHNYIPSYVSDNNPMDMSHSSRASAQALHSGPSAGSLPLRGQSLATAMPVVDEDEHHNLDIVDDYEVDSYDMDEGVVNQRMSVLMRPLPQEDPSETPGERANRIRSFYKEYFDDSKPYISQAPLPSTSAEYYEDYGSEFTGGTVYDAVQDGFVVAAAPYAEPITRRAMTPPPRAPPRFMPPGPRHRSRAVSNAGSHHLHPSRGPSAMSNYAPRIPSAMSNRSRGRPRQPVPPPKALSSLPTPHLLKDDAAIFGAADFAPPMTFRDRQNGRRADSPKGVPRPYSPSVRAFVPINSSFDDLSAMPSPHMLRKSGAFNALDFAPPSRFKQDNGSDTASIRSGRSGISQQGLHSIRAGAYRMSRVPKELAGSKTDIMAGLKPTWDLRGPA